MCFCLVRSSTADDMFQLSRFLMCFCLARSSTTDDMFELSRFFMCFCLARSSNTDDMFELSRFLMCFCLARSSTTDDRFELCHFENDPPPVGSHVRSHVPKVLWREYFQLFTALQVYTGYPRHTFDPFRAGVNFRHQNLTSTDVRV